MMALRSITIDSALRTFGFTSGLGSSGLPSAPTMKGDSSRTPVEGEIDDAAGRHRNTLRSLIPARPFTSCGGIALYIDRTGPDRDHTRRTARVSDGDLVEIGLLAPIVIVAL